MRTERSAERDLDQKDRLDALRDRLAASEDKQDRLYSRLLDARERITRLLERSRLLEECLSEAKEHNAALMEENRLLRHRLSEAPERIRLTERSRLLLGAGAAPVRREPPGGSRQALAHP